MDGWMKERSNEWVDGWCVGMLRNWYRSWYGIVITVITSLQNLGYRRFDLRTSEVAHGLVFAQFLVVWRRGLSAYIAIFSVLLHPPKT